MKKSSTKDRNIIDSLKSSQSYYNKIGIESDYFSALWPTLSVGHMLTTDLSRICRRFKLSLADFNLMGALRVNLPLRPTDLAVKVQVSNAALTARIAKLIERGFLEKFSAEGDRRASILKLTQDGIAIVDAVHIAIEHDSHFVHEVHRLSEDDRAAFERIMGELHNRLDRHLVNAPR